MHVNETAPKSAALGRKHCWPGSSGSACSRRCYAVHMTHARRQRSRAHVGGGATSSTAPQSNLELGNGICPVPRLLASRRERRAGHRGAACNNDLDLLDEMRTAALLASGVGSDAGSLISSAHGLRSQHSAARGRWGWATHRLARAGQVGRPVLHRSARAPHAAGARPAATARLAASRDQVTDVWVAGAHCCRWPR